MTKHSYAAKAFSLLLALVLTLSLAVNSAAAVSFQDMNPKDDALLGTKFNVDATITLVTGKDGKDVSLSIPVSGMSKEALAAAITAGTVTLALERDDSRPYVNEELFPYAYAGGDLDSWMTEGKDEHQFTDIKLTANEKNGKAVLDVSFHVNNYFYSTNRRTGETTPDYSVPHVNGSYYIDLCGYFDLTAKNSGKSIGSAPVKVAPYENFNTMWEIYKELDTIAANGTKNGLYVERFSMGQSTAGRDMPYLIVADSKASVTKWLALAERAETEPDAVLADIKSGKLDDIRVPVMYSNIHPDEVAATDGVLDFAKMITSEKSIDYKTLTGFTAAGEKELKEEMGPVGAEGSVAVPDLVKDTASYLGYLSADNNGKSGKVDLEKYYTVKSNTVNVKDELLSDVFFVLVPEENVDGRTYLTRHSTNGYDLNRDNSFQTTSETANMQQLIGTFNPISLAEFHGRVQSFQCEPCDPPHEPNFEYDLLANHLITGGEALGIAAVANNDGYNSYVIPQRDYLTYTGSGTETYWEDPWDDMSTSYTPQFAMLQGTVAYTVELPAYNDDTAQAAQYGILGNAAYVAAEKLSYLESQVTIFQRGVKNFNSDAFELVGQWLCDQNDVEGAEMDLFRPEYTGKGQNGNFYPECYIIPLDGENQTNLQAASDMMEWLTRNDVKVNVTEKDFTYDGVTYPAGTMIVSMYQAKRSVANGALYDGTLINSWTILYSEGITSFNETRGFDMVTVAEPAAYKTISAVCGSPMDHDDALAYMKGLTSYFAGEKDKDVIISNASEDSTAAVNELLKAGKTVGMVTSGDCMGDFICSYTDYQTVAGKYLLSATGVDKTSVKAKIITKSPTVYVPGTPAESEKGFVYAPQISQSASWNYDTAAMNLMGFTTTSDVAKADAAAGASKLDSAAKTAVKNGLPYIGYSYSAASSASDLIAGVEYTELDGAMDCLTPVVYPNKTLVNASYILDGDGILYAYGLGYFSQIPAGAAVLVKSDKTRTPTEGFVPTNTAERAASFKAYMNGGVQGFAYKENGMNVVLFANSLTHKVHQRDEYAYISNFLFSSVLSDKNYDGSESVALPFTDVAEGAYYADAVAWAIQNKVTSGVSATTFAPNASCTRGQMVTFLWKAAGSPEPKSLTTAFTDVKSGAYYEKAVAWAVENKVTTGTSATTFSPDATVTRGQSVTFLWKANNSPAAEGTSAFTDVAAGVYYAPAVAWAVEKGVTSGMSATTFAPNSNCTRAQIVTFLYRAASAK
ncbi:MAG: M14 family metallopeptidase [Oscillospiraceae bacterium]